MNASSSTPGSFDSVPLSTQTIACLKFFQRWETPLDQQAAKLYMRVRYEASDFAAFQRLAPAGSEERALFERFLGSFEEAGQLIREGQMRADLFFDSWYALPAAWHRVQPHVVGLRAEYHTPDLYENFAWLAQRAEQFWEDQHQYPVQWCPLTNPEPTPDDQAIFEAFHQHTFPAPENAGWKLFAALQQQAATFEAFSQMVPAGSADLVTFDWLMCAYDRAGVLIKNGIIHPALLFATWRSPQEVWQVAEPGVKGLRQESKVEQLYENAQWLAAFESEWQQKQIALSNQKHQPLT